MRNSAYNIAVCAMFGALQLIFLVCAKYVEILTLSFYALSVCALIMPLTKKMYKESILTYFAVSILSFFLSLIPECFVYILLCGAYTLLVVLFKEKKVTPFVAIPVKVIWVNISFFVFYIFFREFITLDLSKFGINEVPLWAYLVAVSIIAVIYDFLIKYLFTGLERLSDRIFRN